MALKLAKNVPQGIVADYWKVTLVTINPIEGKANVTLSLFISEDQKDAYPIENMNVVLEHDGFKASSPDLEKMMLLAYEELKKRQDLLGARDV